MIENTEPIEVKVKSGKCANMKSYMKTYMKEYHMKYKGDKQCECGATIKELNYNHKDTDKHKTYIKVKELEEKLKELQV